MRAESDDTGVPEGVDWRTLLEALDVEIEDLVARSAAIQCFPRERALAVAATHLDTARMWLEEYRRTVAYRVEAATREWVDDVS